MLFCTALDYPMLGLFYGTVLGILALGSCFALCSVQRCCVQLVALGTALVSLAGASLLRVPNAVDPPTLQISWAVVPPAIAIYGIVRRRAWALSFAIATAVSSAWMWTGSYTSTMGQTYGWVFVNFFGYSESDGSDPDAFVRDLMIGQLWPLAVATCAAVVVLGVAARKDSQQRLDPTMSSSPRRLRLFHLSVACTTFWMLILGCCLAERIDEYGWLGVPGGLKMACSVLGLTVVVANNRRVLGVVMLVPAALSPLLVPPTTIGWSRLSPLADWQLGPPQGTVWCTVGFLLPLCLSLACAASWSPILGHKLRVGD